MVSIYDLVCNFSDLPEQLRSYWAFEQVDEDNGVAYRAWISVADNVWLGRKSASDTAFYLHAGDAEATLTGNGAYAGNTLVVTSSGFCYTYTNAGSPTSENGCVILGKTTDKQGVESWGWVTNLNGAYATGWAAMLFGKNDPVWEFSQSNSWITIFNSAYLCQIVPLANANGIRWFENVYTVFLRGGSWNRITSIDSNDYFLTSTKWALGD